MLALQECLTMGNLSRLLSARSGDLHVPLASFAMGRHPERVACRV
jgi:hypothetical protein